MTTEQDRRIRLLQLHKIQEALAQYRAGVHQALAQHQAAERAKDERIRLLTAELRLELDLLCGQEAAK